MAKSDRRKELEFHPDAWPRYERLNEHLEHEDGEVVFRHACKMGLEGIVSKRKDSHYRSGRSPDWLKMKNPACAAVRREMEEDWS
jgi:bifunctional non-homologous end joining protein LigD